jgi:hypothetical protein
MKLYHKSDVKNIESILQNGLQMKYSNHFKYPSNPDTAAGAVYLCTHPDMDMGLGHALFEVDIDVAPTGWEVVLFEDVPPESIKYLGEYGANKSPMNNKG